ncbi:MAG: efflux RND transporter periplasmic adaptor subunit [Candidatus Stygibacter frigidus]|nr:efflux RND transporter periplasmic adaptor subunit [Candidatus Stygibacter frigidus]
MKQKVKRVIIWVIIIIFAGFLSWRVLELVRPDDSNSRGGYGGALAVETEQVHRGTIREVREFSGTVRPEYQYIITAKVSGRLEKLSRREGDFVEANEVIGNIDDVEYQLALLDAQANLADAESKKFVMEQEFNRSQALYDKEYITQSEFELSQSAYNSALAKVKQAESAQRMADLKLEYTNLRSSRAGFVAERFFDEGTQLTINSPVISIVGIDKVLIKSSLVENIYGRITIGQKATLVTDAYPTEVFTGAVSLIAPVLNEQSRMAEMEIEVNNENHKLKPGMFCKIKLILSESENAQIVPNKAIIKENGESGIFVEDNNVARYIPVETGISDEQNTEIVKPEIDKPVITLGQFQLKDGSKVNPVSK